MARAVPLVVRVVPRRVVPLVVRVVSRLPLRVVPLRVVPLRVVPLRVVSRLRRRVVPLVDSFPRMHHRVWSSIRVAKVRPSFRNRQIQTVPLV